VARELLTETGSIFVQIGDENVHHVREVLDEVFGPDNSVCVITFQKTSSATSRTLAGVVDFVLWYAKDSDRLKYRQLYLGKEAGAEGASQYTWVQLPDGRRMDLNAFA